MWRMYWLLAVVSVLSACTDEAGARRVLAQEGYTNIKITGYSTMCGDGDDFATGFSATNAVDRHVEGAVCSGTWKGHTIRFK